MSIQDKSNQPPVEPRVNNPMARPGAALGRGPGAHGPGGFGRPVEKPKDFKGTLRRLVGYLKPHRAAILGVFGMAVLSTVFSVAGPKILGQSITILYNGIVAKAQGLSGAGIDYGKV
ncbi:MAG: hypothetical protein ABIJ86_06555, partial [Spirochaetota bacterium]